MRSSSGSRPVRLSSLPPPNYGEPRIEYVRLDAFIKADRNPKKHDLAGTQASIRRFGFVDPPVINEATGKLSAGHGRGEALEAMRAAGEPAPLRIKVDDEGVWWVPVLRGIGFKNDAEAEAYLLASNKLVEAGGWDELGVANILADFKKLEVSFDGLGMSASEISRLLAMPGSGVNVVEDNPPPLPTTAITKPGDIWQLGRHLVICGDCRDAQVWEGRKLKWIWTDPPYGVDYTGGMKKREKIKNDGGIGGVVQLLEVLYPLLLGATDPGVAWYVATASTFVEMQVLLQRFEIFRQTLIWDKGSFALGRSDYRYAHEPIHYGWTPGAAHRWFGARDKSTVLRFPRPAKNEEHPTMKPTALIAHCLENSSEQGDLGGDPFLGSGSTIMAAEQLGRSVIGTELEPRYVDVIVTRWEKLTGGKAVLQPSSPTLKGKGGRQPRAKSS